jgi:PAS domain S-box-containing protein
LRGSATRVGSRHDPPAAYGKVRLERLVWAAVLVVCATLVAVAGWATWTARVQAHNRAKDVSANLATVFKQNTERAVATVDMLLGVVARDLGPNPADVYRQSLTTASLASLTQRLPHLVAVRVIDGVSGSIEYEFLRSNQTVDHSEEEALSAHSADPRRGLYVNKPLRDAKTGSWLVGISRRISGRDGIPGNIVVAYISLDHLQGLYEGVSVSSGTTISLFRTDGITLMRTPEAAKYTGRDISGSRLFRELLPLSPEGHYATVAASDGVSRLFSYRMLDDLPLVVTVGIPTDEVKSAWLKEARWSVALSLGAIVVVVALGLFLSREMRRRDSAETALQESERRLRLALQAGRMVAWELDPKTRMLSDSHNADSIVGTGLRTIDDFLSRVHPDDRARVNEALLSAISDGEGIFEFRYLRPDGQTLWLEARSDHLCDAAGTSRLIGVSFDVTERHKVQDDLRAAKEAAEDARLRAEQASEAKTEFLASMSHEIRTPLNGILGFADLLLDRDDLQPEVRRQGGLIRISGEALLTVVNDVLDFARVEAGAIELEQGPFALKTLLDDCVSIVEAHAAKKAITVAVELDPSISDRVIGDEARLRQVLLNLLNNAMKFTPSGRVELRVAPDDARGSGWLRFSVQDTGIGIPADKLPRLFQRFSQVDGSASRQFGGIGLGLAISKKLIDLMQGDIGVHSTPGIGSTFWFTVPLEPAVASPTVARPAPDLPAITSPSKRILLAEDVATNQEIAKAILEAAGHSVHVVSNGVEAVEAVQTAAFDLVLMDVQMPDMDGVTATKHIRALEGPVRTIPILALTANVYTEQIARFISAGFDGHIAKPFKRAELCAAVAQWTSATGPLRGTGPAHAA